MHITKKKERKKARLNECMRKQSAPLCTDYPYTTIKKTWTPRAERHMAEWMPDMKKKSAHPELFYSYPKQQNAPRRNNAAAARLEMPARQGPTAFPPLLVSRDYTEKRKTKSDRQRPTAFPPLPVSRDYTEKRKTKSDRQRPTAFPPRPVSRDYTENFLLKSNGQTDGVPSSLLVSRDCTEKKSQIDDDRRHSLLSSCQPRLYRKKVR